MVASKAANLPYAELEASPVSPPNWAGPASALVLPNRLGERDFFRIFLRELETAAPDA